MRPVSPFANFKCLGQLNESRGSLALGHHNGEYRAMVTYQTQIEAAGTKSIFAYPGGVILPLMCYFLPPPTKFLSNPKHHT